MLAACSRKDWRIQPNGPTDVASKDICDSVPTATYSGYSSHREGTVIFCDPVGKGVVET